MKNKEFYKNWLNDIMTKYDCAGGFLHSTYQKGIEEEDFNSCYIDDRVRNGKKLKKEIAELLDHYFESFPEAKKPLYSYR